jgi:hypothetical protein
MSDDENSPVAAQEPPRDDDEPEADTPPQITSAGDWRDAEQPLVIALPSGNVAKMRQPPVLYLSLTGRIPAPIIAALKAHQADKEEFTLAEKDLLLDWLICEASVEPPISLHKTAGAVPIGKLSPADKNAIIAGLGLIAQFFGLMR